MPKTEAILGRPLADIDADLVYLSGLKRRVLSGESAFQLNVDIGSIELQIDKALDARNLWMIINAGAPA